MKCIKRRELDQKGSALILVIVALSFIGILGSLILSLTAMNLRMKVYDRESKKNQYESEAAVTELRTGLEEVSAKAMEEAYREVMDTYVTINRDETLTNAFDKRYLVRLIYYLSNNKGNAKIFMETPTKENFEKANIYDYQLLVNYISSDDAASKAEREAFENVMKKVTDADEAVIECPWAESGFDPDMDVEHNIVLKNLTFKFVNDQGYETTVKTDVVMDTPLLYFSSGIFPEYTKYSLIADDTLNFNAAASAVNGNIYGGPGTSYSVKGASKTKRNYIDVGGIRFLAGSHVDINAENIITRGNFTTLNNASVNVKGKGAGAVANIFAENIVTEKGSFKDGANPAEMDLTANCYVSNDLTLDAKNSNVAIKSGRYEGFSYNFSNNEADAAGGSDENYSSAILMNGKNSSLKMGSISHVSLAGRAFISREQDASPAGSKADDIMMGQSAAVKSDQVSYLVPDEYMTFNHNPLLKSEEARLNELENESPVDVDALKADIGDDILSDKAYTKYYYNEGAVPVVYYYLEFRDNAAANKFFTEYYSVAANKKSMENLAATFISKGGAFNVSANLTLSNVIKYDNNKVSSVNDGNTIDTIAQMCKTGRMSAREYKARQLVLISNQKYQKVTDKTIRFTVESGKENKGESPIFNTLIDEDNIIKDVKKQADVSIVAPGFAEVNGLPTKIVDIPLNKEKTSFGTVYIVHNQGANTFKVDSTIKDGIVVATGNVEVKDDYTGLIISGGVIRVIDGAGTLSADSLMVQTMLKYAVDAEKAAGEGDDSFFGGDATELEKWKTATDPSEGEVNGEKMLTPYFKECAEKDSINSIDTVNIADYTQFINWSKNKDE